MLFDKLGLKGFLRSTLSAEGLVETMTGSHDSFAGDLDIVLESIHVALPKQRFLPRQLVRVP